MAKTVSKRLGKGGMPETKDNPGTSTRSPSDLTLCLPDDKGSRV